MVKKKRSPTAVISFRVPVRVRATLERLAARLTAQRSRLVRLTEAVVEAIEEKAVKEKVQ